MKSSRIHHGRLIICGLLLFIFGLFPNLIFVQAQANKMQAKTPIKNSKATVAEAEKFVTEAEARLLDLSLKSSRADWVNSNFITSDTEAIAADAKKEYIAAVSELAEASRKFDGLKLPYDTARKLGL